MLWPFRRYVYLGYDLGSLEKVMFTEKAAYAFLDEDPCCHWFEIVDVWKREVIGGSPLQRYYESEKEGSR